VAGDGSWHAPGTQQSVSSSGGVVEVTLAPSSAALVTVSPAG
jgi:ferric-dicitrate binding protein FerR (iron transport regulator)